MEGAGLDGVGDAGFEGAALGVGEVVGGAGLDGVAEGVWLDGVAACVVDPTGLGAGAVAFSGAEDAEGDGLAGDDPELG